MLFPLMMIKLKMGILAGAVICCIIALGLVKIPEDVWYPIIQIAVFTTVLIGVSPKLTQYSTYFNMIVERPVYALIPVGIFVIILNLFQTIFRQNREQFEVASRSPFCPPKLDFTHDNIDTDNERQTPACISDPNKLTEEQQLDEIDIYLRDVQESIARINGYLNVAKPDERWLSKAEMDAPENQNLAKEFVL